MRTSKSYQYGIIAEQLVSEYLERDGYKITTTRYKSPFGEIDIVAEKKNLIVFIEVKARKNLNHHEVLSTYQIKRISRTANYYLATLDKLANEIRFDFILINGNKIVSHLENAWEYLE